MGWAKYGLDDTSCSKEAWHGPRKAVLQNEALFPESCFCWRALKYPYNFWQAEFLEKVFLVCVWGGGNGEDNERLSSGALWVLIPACCSKKKVPTYWFPSLDWHNCHHCVSLSYRALSKETLICPLVILILVSVETISGTLSKVFVCMVRADSSDRLSDTSHFSWNLRLAKKTQVWLPHGVSAVKSSQLD